MMSDTHSKFLNDILEKSATYQKKFNKFSTETLVKIVEDRIVALKYAKEAIVKKDPKCLTNELLTALADEMQNWAKAILKERNEQK
jgi:hypothetical protein